LSDIALVLDTNVMKEILSIHDLSREIKTAGGGAAALQSHKVSHRIARAKYSTLLGWVCSVRAWNTLSLLDEMLEVLVRDVPPEERQAVNTAATQILIHFVKELILRKWTLATDTDVPKTIRADEADDTLVSLAAREGVPLISNEGNSPDGIRDTNARGKPNIRAKAKTAGVLVFTPEQYLQRESIVVNLEARNFLRAYQTQRTSYDPGTGVPGEAEKMMDYLFSIYRFVLLNEVDEDLASVPRAPVS
jgi:hypothetical protein